MMMTQSLDDDDAFIKWMDGWMMAQSVMEDDGAIDEGG
jgi:hypothetical protein